MPSKAYKIEYKRSVERDLRKLPDVQLKSVIAKISSLGHDPRPDGAVKLRGATGLYRIRHADYRIIYQVHDGKLIVLVVKVGHRREVYRDF